MCVCARVFSCVFTCLVGRHLPCVGLVLGAGGVSTAWLPRAFVDREELAVRQLVLLSICAHGLHVALPPANMELMRWGSWKKISSKGSPPVRGTPLKVWPRSFIFFPSKPVRPGYPESLGTK